MAKTPAGTSILPRCFLFGAEALQLNPDFRAGYFNRAEAYAAGKQWDLAIADYDRAIQSDPNAWLAFDERGFAYDSKGDFARAIQDYDGSIRLSPGWGQAQAR